MSWKDLKRFWFEPTEVNEMLAETINEIKADRIITESITINTAVGYAVIESARNATKDAIHLVIGVSDNWLSEYIERILVKIDCRGQQVITVVPEYLKDYLMNLGNDNVYHLGELDKLSKKTRVKRKLASVYVYSYEHMFNWEHYSLDLRSGGYLIFDNVTIPDKRTENIPGWECRGRFSDLFFFKRTE